MKNFSAVILATCLFSAAAAASFSDADLSFAKSVKLDITGDGKINKSDVISLNDFFHGKTKKANASDYDFNEDGKTNIADYITFKSKYAEALLNEEPKITTTEKPAVTTTAVTTVKPASTTAAVTTVKPAVTTAAVTTVKPAATTAAVTTVKPAVTTDSVTTVKPAVTTASVTTVKPAITTASVTTVKPAATTATITTAEPSSTTVPVTTKAVTTTVTEKAKPFNIKTSPTFEVTSKNLTDGVWDDVISNTNRGSNSSPQLSWEPVENASCYAIYMIDTSAGNWMHWKSANITETELKLGWAKSSEYVGPYPPSGTHKYSVYIFALKEPVSNMSGKFDDQNSGITTLAKSLDKTSTGANGNIIAYGNILGTFTR